MTWVDLILLLILSSGVLALGRKHLRKHIYKGVDRDFASHCALSIEESPLLQLSIAPEGSTGLYLILDTETICFLHDGTRRDSLANMATPLLASLSWILLDQELRVVRREDHILKTGMPISPEATDYHHMTTDFVAGHGLDPKMVLGRLLAELKGVQMVIGHHLPFHLAVLEHDLVWYDLPTDVLDEIRQFCTMRQGINYLINRYQADPLQDRISLEALYSKLLWERESIEITYELKSRHDVVLTTHCFIKLYRETITSHYAHIEDEKPLLHSQSI